MFEGLSLDFAAFEIDGDWSSGLEVVNETASTLALEKVKIGCC